MLKRTQKSVLVLSLLASLAISLWFAFHQRASVEVHRSELELRDGLLYQIESDKPFTGVLYENFPLPAGGTVALTSEGERRVAAVPSNERMRKTEVEIRRGKVHGRSVGYFDNGQMEVEEFFVNGLSNGVRTRWYRDGGKLAEEPIKNGQLEGSYVKWHENGTRAITMTLVGGQREGLAKAWDTQGVLKSLTHFSADKIVKQEILSKDLESVEATDDTSSPLE